MVWGFTSSLYPGTSLFHLRPRIAALLETNQTQYSMSEREFQQSQKNVNQSSVPFQGREKTSCPTGSGLRQVARKTGPAPKPRGGTERARGGYSAGGKCNSWATGPDTHGVLVLETNHHLPRNGIFLSGAAGWRKFSERHVPGAPERQPLALPVSFAQAFNPRKGHGLSREPAGVLISLCCSVTQRVMGEKMN